MFLYYIIEAVIFLLLTEALFIRVVIPVLPCCNAIIIAAPYCATDTPAVIVSDDVKFPVVLGE